MNATDSEERIRQGFEVLLETLREALVPPQVSTIRSNTAAREKAQNRVWGEYTAIGQLPPSDFALSVTARRELGIGIEYRTHEAAE